MTEKNDINFIKQTLHKVAKDINLISTLVLIWFVLGAIAFVAALVWAGMTFSK